MQINVINTCFVLFHQIGGFLVTISAILSVWYFFFETTDAAFTVFLPRLPDVSVELSSFLIFCSYVIVLNTLVPMSLYVRYICQKNVFEEKWVEFEHCMLDFQPGDNLFWKQFVYKLGQRYVLS